MIIRTNFFLIVTLIVNINCVEIIRQGVKVITSWNKYRTEIKTQTKQNNSDYLIDPTFRKINIAASFIQKW